MHRYLPETPAAAKRRCAIGAAGAVRGNGIEWRDGAIRAGDPDIDHLPSSKSRAGEGHARARVRR